MTLAERCHKIAFINAGRLIAVDTPANLKNKVIEGILVELDLPQAIQKINSIESLSYVNECSIHGAVLHVLLDSKDNIQMLQEFTGVMPQIIEPSLEDVFLALSKRRKEGGRVV